MFAVLGELVELCTAPEILKCTTVYPWNSLEIRLWHVLITSGSLYSCIPIISSFVLHGPNTTEIQLKR